MLNLAEYRKKTTSLADYLPWACLVGPGIVLNKDGSFQRTLRYRGPDLDSATDAELVSITARLNNILKRFGVETTFVSATDAEAWRRAIKPNTRMLFLETPSNPLTEISDVAELAKTAHESGALLVVDNCFCTPILQRPLDLGAHQHSE